MRAVARGHGSGLRDKYTRASLNDLVDSLYIPQTILMSHPMDSQLTLVNPSVAATGGNTILVFDKDDMKKTIIRIPGDTRPCYSVNTVDEETTVHAGATLIATIERKTLRPDSIILRDSLPMHLTDWLKAPILSSFPLTFEERGRRLEWRTNFIGQLALYDPSVRESGPIAWFAKSRRRVVDGQLVAYNAFLAIKPEYDDVRDAIVVSCLLAEQKLRIYAKDAALGEGRAQMM